MATYGTYHGCIVGECLDVTGCQDKQPVRSSGLEYLTKGTGTDSLRFQNMICTVQILEHLVCARNHDAKRSKLLSTTEMVNVH